jgi:hypothetical protein
MRCLPRCASAESQAAAPRSGGFSIDIRSRSKKSLRAAEQERADVALARRRWIREQSMLNSSRLVFIDETAANTKMVRLSGRCPRGERLVGRVPHGHWKTITFVAALRHNGLTAPFVLDGSMTGRNISGICQAMSGSNAQAQRNRHHGQPLGSQGPRHTGGD